MECRYNVYIIYLMYIIYIVYIIYNIFYGWAQKNQGIKEYPDWWNPNQWGWA